MSETWLNKVNWSEDGLITAIAQDASSGRVLMVAWMNRDALKLTWQKMRQCIGRAREKNYGIKGKNQGTSKK